MKPEPISRRAYSRVVTASSWEEIWEAGPYFDRVSDLLEDAHDYAVFVGWQIDSRLRFKIPERPGQQSESFTQVRETLKQKILRICEKKPKFQFYFLMWDHAYLYVFERETWQGRVWEDVHPHVHFVFDNRHAFGGSHHEKICIIDGKTAFCGGIDLCDERWDSPQHLYYDPRRSLHWKSECHGPYHDLAVQVTGPICAQIQLHIASRWNALSSIEFPKPLDFEEYRKNAPGHEVYLSQTRVDIETSHGKVGVVREIEFLFRDLIEGAQSRIIFEGQYYWSETLNDILIAKIHEMRGKPFEIYLILAEPQSIKSLTRYMAPYELHLLKKVELAAAFAGVKLVMGYPFAYLDSLTPSGSRFTLPKPVYIHSKILVIDDTYLCIGSANFAARALRIDTEINLTLVARTPMERCYIQRVARHVLDHWNIDRFIPHSGGNLRLAKPNLGDSRHLSWARYYDPVVPWGYRIKLKFLRLVSRSRVFLVLFLAFVWTLGVCLTRYCVGDWDISEPWILCYSALMASVWVIPIPFMSVMFFSGLHLGPEVASRITVSAFWVSSVLGYAIARIFPRSAASYYDRLYKEKHWGVLFHKLGVRKFSELLSILLDPRVPIHLRILYQGLFCMPLPWFALGSGLIIPAFLYVSCRWGVEYGYSFIPNEFITIAKNNAVVFLCLVNVTSIGKAGVKLWKKSV